MSSKNTKAVQTPGGNSLEPSGTPPENSNPASADPAGNVGTQQTEPTVAELMAELAALKKQVEQQNRPAPTRKEADESLPDTADIDQSALKSPVLTRQGWLVPDDFGSPAASKGK